MMVKVIAHRSKFTITGRSVVKVVGGTSTGRFLFVRHVCLCPRAYLQNYVTSDLHQLPVRLIYDRVSVLLWRLSDMLCISGFTNDVIFAYIMGHVEAYQYRCKRLTSLRRRAQDNAPAASYTGCVVSMTPGAETLDESIVQRVPGAEPVIHRHIVCLFVCLLVRSLIQSVIDAVRGAQCAVQGLCNALVSVRPSMRLSRPSTVAATLAAELGRPRCECGWCHAESRCARLNTEWFTRKVYRKNESYCVIYYAWGGSVTEWLACWTQAQNGPGSDRSRDAVG